MDSTRKTGIIVLAILGATMLLANGFAYVLPIWWGPDDTEVILVYLTVGILASEAGLISVWTVLGADSLRRRLMFLVSGVLALICSLWFGFLMTMPIYESIGMQNKDFVITAAGVAPWFLVGAMAPFVVVRWAGRLISRTEIVSGQGSVSIAGIMLFTAMVALGIAGVEWAAPTMLLNTANEKLTTAGIIFGIAFGVSLIGILPLMLLLLSEHIKVPGVVALIYAFIPGLVGAAIVEGIQSDGTSFFPNEWTSNAVPMLIIPGACCLTVCWFFFGMRLLGFRLRKQK